MNSLLHLPKDGNEGNCSKGFGTGWTLAPALADNIMTAHAHHRTWITKMTGGAVEAEGPLALPAQHIVVNHLTTLTAVFAGMGTQPRTLRHGHGKEGRITDRVAGAVRPVAGLEQVEDARRRDHGLHLAVGVLGPGGVGLSPVVVGCHLFAVERGRIIGSRAVTAAAATAVPTALLAHGEFGCKAKVWKSERSAEFDQQ